MAARACLILLALLLPPASAWAQGAVQWFGGSTVGHLPMITGGALLMDAGGSPGAGQQPLNNALAGTIPTGVGFINTGYGLCQWTNHSDAGYSELCSGFDGSGNVRFLVDRIGGGPAPTCTFLVNGVSTPCGSSGGTVTSITATSPIVVTPSPITATGVVSHANSGVTAAAYTNANITVDAKGHITVAANGSGGTVSSVTFTGDGVVDSSTPSAAVTTTGTLTATIKTQAAKKVLAGPVSGGDVAPTFRQLACADLSDASTGCSGAASAVGANPTATAGIAAVNGSAATFMRSDGAPAVVAATTSVAGIAKLNNVGYPAGWVATINPNNAVVVTVGQASTITAIIGRVETAAGGAATVSVYKAPSGTACSGGTVLHSGSFNANGTAATNQTLTVTTSSLAAGDSICYQTTGTTSWTGGTAIGAITVFFAPS